MSTTCSTTGSTSHGACRSARPVSPPPHGLSRGKRARSASRTRAPPRARWIAVADPAGPAPTTRTSKRSIMQGRGFEPLKAEPAGLQPAPFGHSGTPARLRSVAASPGGAADENGKRRARSEDDEHRPHHGRECIVTRRGTRGTLRPLALLAQLVEHLHGKEGVGGSSPPEGLPSTAPNKPDS